MSQRKINLTKTFCPVWKFKAKASETKATANLEYVDDFEGWESRAPEFGSVHPDLSGLVLVDLEADRMEGGKVRVSLGYETNNPEATYPGRPEGETDPVKRYDFEIPTAEEHMLGNPYFDALSEGERTALLNISNGAQTKENGALWEADVTSELGLSGLAKIKKGTTHFLLPGFVWIERFTTDDLSDVEITKTGEVMDPPGPRPDPGENRDYLYLGSTGRNSEDGASWEVERRWQLSGKGKWDADLYAAD